MASVWITGHANIAEGVLDYIRVLKKKLLNIHFHDNMGKNDNHLAIGEGNIPWGKFAEELALCNYDGSFISECRNITPGNAAQLLNERFQILS